MKSKDQELLEEAYGKVVEMRHPHGMRELGSKPSNEPSSSDIKAQEEEERNTERNFGEVEEPVYRSKPQGELGSVYSKHGRKYIVVKNKDTGKVGPFPVEFSKGEDVDGERFEVFYKITGVDEEGYPVSEPTGQKKPMLPATQWGVKDVPGGDID